MRSEEKIRKSEETIEMEFSHEIAKINGAKWMWPDASMKKKKEKAFSPKLQLMIKVSRDFQWTSEEFLQGEN